MVFHLTRKYLEEQISDSKIALQKHHEGVRVHELVMKAFEAEIQPIIIKEMSEELQSIQEMKDDFEKRFKALEKRIIPKVEELASLPKEKDGK